MTKLRDELAIEATKRDDVSARKLISRSLDSGNRKARKPDLDAGADFDMKLSALKECIAEVRNQYEEKFIVQSISSAPAMSSEATQTVLQLEEGKHVISVNDDEEEARERLAKEVLSLKREINDFEQKSADRNSNNFMQKLEFDGEIWNLKAELAFLKKRITDEEADKKRLQKHIQELQSTIQDKEDDLVRMDLIKEMEEKKSVESAVVDEDVLEVLKVEAIVQQLEGEKRKLQQTVDDLEKRLKLATEEKEKLRKEVAAVREASEKSRFDLERRLKLAEGEKEKFEKDLKDVREFSESTIADLKKRLKLLEEDKEKLSKEFITVQELSTKCSDFEERLKLAEEEKEKLEKDLAFARESTEKLTFDLEKRLKSKEEEKSKLRQEMEVFRGSAEKYKREAEEKDLDIASLKKDIENLTSDVESLRTRLARVSHLEGRVVELEFENKNFHDENSTLKTELSKMKDKCTEMESEQITKYVSEVEGLNQELSKARQERELSGVEINRLRDQSVNLSKEVNHLRNFLNTANTENELLKTEAYERRKELERLSWYLFFTVSLTVVSRCNLEVNMTFLPLTRNGNRIRT